MRPDFFSEMSDSHPDPLFLRRLHVAKRTPARIFEFWPRASSHNLPCVASKIRRGAGARDTSCERRNVKRRVRKTGNPRRAHERETRRRQRTGANAGAVARAMVRAQSHHTLRRA